MTHYIDHYYIDPYYMTHYIDHYYIDPYYMTHYIVNNVKTDTTIKHRQLKNFKKIKNF